MSENFPDINEIKNEAEEAASEIKDAANNFTEKVDEAAAGAADAANETVSQAQNAIPSYTYSTPQQPSWQNQAYSAPAQQAQYRASQQNGQAYGQYAPGQYAGGGQQYYGYGYGAQGYAQPQTDAVKPEKKKKEKKEKKEKRPFTKGGAIALALLTLLLSCCAGFAGSYLYGRFFKSGGADGTAVMYRSVETKADDAALSGSQASVAAVADTVSDSVVEITTEFVTTGYFSFGQYVNKGAGSGVIVSEDGYIVTNNHVIADTDNGNVLASKIAVRLRNGEEYPAEVVGRDEDADIAIIKIEAKDLSAAVWGDSDSLAVGEQIVVVGNPLGELGGTVTTGIVSASDREIKIDDTKMSLIQTDAAVNPGNSGGGMFNLKGELVGIVNAKSSGTGIEGLGFAIPSNDAKDVAEQLLEYGYVKGKVYLGISFYEANMGGWFSTSSSGVLYVYSCEEGYNDDVLQYGDQVVAVDGTAVSTKADVKAILQDHEVGDKLTFTILRNGKTVDVKVTCYEYKPDERGISFGN